MRERARGIPMEEFAEAWWGERHREQADDPKGLGMRTEYTYPCDGDRNYRALLERFVPERKISLYKVPEEIGTDEWYCMRVRL